MRIFFSYFLDSLLAALAFAMASRGRLRLRFQKLIQAAHVSFLTAPPVALYKDSALADLGDFFHALHARSFDVGLAESGATLGLALGFGAGAAAGVLARV
jgi:hypothetical protein